MDNLLVMKFGGTSMGSAERIRVAADISRQQHAKRPVVVVVSAMAKITDLLLDSLRKAEAGDQADLDTNLKTLYARHFECCRALLPASRQEATLAEVHALISEFSRIAKGCMMLGDRPPRSIDEAVAIGEKLTALLLAEYLESEGVPAAAVSGADVIATDAVFGNATPLMEPTRERAAAVIGKLLQENILPVMTGFNGSTLDGRPTTLGRGGSDFSASIAAAALDATELWIWTDVDGIMTGDPRLVLDARVLEAVTYNEAAELAYNGAKSAPPAHAGSLGRSGRFRCGARTASAPEKPGTRDRAENQESARGPHAVTSMADVALVSMEPANSTLSGTRGDGAGARSNCSGECRSAGDYQLQLSPEFLLLSEASGSWNA